MTSLVFTGRLLETPSPPYKLRANARIEERFGNALGSVHGLALKELLLHLAAAPKAWLSRSSSPSDCMAAGQRLVKDARATLERFADGQRPLEQAEDRHFWPNLLGRLTAGLPSDLAVELPIP